MLWGVIRITFRGDSNDTPEHMFCEETKISIKFYSKNFGLISGYCNQNGNQNGTICFFGIDRYQSQSRQQQQQTVTNHNKQEAM